MGERGTTLLLVPAATLVLIVLAAIAVDLSTLHLARRELVRAVSQAADDGASVPDMDALRRDGELRVDLAAARRVAVMQLRTADLAGRLVGTPQVQSGPGTDTITVTATIEVDHLFAGGIAGAGRPERITVTASGRLAEAGVAP